MAKTMRLQFDVYGRRIEIEATADGWATFIPGNEGKRRPAGIAIPADLDIDEIVQYLADLFHESATEQHPSVRLL